MAVRVLLMLAMVALYGCGQSGLASQKSKQKAFERLPAKEKTDATPKSGPPAAASSAVPEIFFAERQPSRENMLAQMRGELILDDEGCLRVRSEGGSHAVVWPAGFEPDTGGGGVRVLDGEGGIVARVGEAVHTAGGESVISDNGAVNERTERGLRERCYGPYWIGAPPVRMPRP